MITALAIVAALIVGLSIGYTAGRIVGSYRAYQNASRMAGQIKAGERPTP
jgi:membrane protein DedA with SNARE-associated domain